MSMQDFTTAAGQTYLDKMALRGLQLNARKTRGPIPASLPADMGETAKNTAALWGILGNDPVDTCVGQSGQVGIANLMTWGMKWGNINTFTPFLPWAVFATHLHDRERIVCEALAHEETLETLDPLLPAVFHEMVFPSANGKKQAAPATSTAFIPAVWAASRHEVLHPVIDQFLPDAIERELAWAPENAAALVLGRYSNSGDISPAFPVIKEIVGTYGNDLRQLANWNCVSLISQVQATQDKEMQDMLRGYKGCLFAHEEDTTPFDGDACMLVRVNPASGIVEAVTNFSSLSHVQISDGKVRESNPASYMDYAKLQAILEEMGSMHFRAIADPAAKAAKAVRHFTSGEKTSMSAAHGLAVAQMVSPR